MPCTDDGVPFPPTSEEIAREKFVRRAEPLLCSACRALERLGYDFDENPELSEWWDNHKKQDAKRLEAERLAEEKLKWERKVINDALDKPVSELTKEEKKLLKKHNFL